MTIEICSQYKGMFLPISNLDLQKVEISGVHSWSFKSSDAVMDWQFSRVVMGWQEMTSLWVGEADNKWRNALWGNFTLEGLLYHNRNLWTACSTKILLLFSILYELLRVQHFMNGLSTSCFPSIYFKTTRSNSWTTLEWSNLLLIFWNN